jgi:branched-chain amino acid transport system substrate-binding protein
MKRTMGIIAAVATALIAALGAGHAANVKVGYLNTFSGPEASSGEQMDRGVKLFMKLNPKTSAGHTVELVERDDTGSAPDRGKRLAQELIARDNVQLITGILFSNVAFAVNDVCRESKVPLLHMNAGTASITEGCPYSARVSYTMWQAGYPLGDYAVKKMGVKTAVLAYANYAPGKDSTNAFREAFEKAGGKIIADIPLPFPNLPDFTPFLQRVKDLKPDAVYVYVPGGKWATGIMKTYNELGMKEAGIKLVGPGVIVQDSELPNMGDVPLGVITVHHYSAAATRPENVAFVKAWKDAYGQNTTPDFLAVQGWDAMAAIYHVVDQTGGKITGDSFLQAIKGWRYASPRGPILIDPETRDIVDNQYLRRVEMRDGKLANVEFDTIEMVKDPWKALGKK